MKVVLDTNVLVAGLRSNQGASFQILRRLGTGQFAIALSVGLVLEYEEILKRQLNALDLSARDVDDVIDYLCSVADLTEIFFLWRPCLHDADDDMLLELAVAGQCDAIVTFNVRDFEPAEQFGMRVLTPPQFLKEIRP
jgi:putative PIN family toxin of toxin-antitoxin system